MLQKWSRLCASNINGQCTNKMETERHSEYVPEREREDDVSVSLEKQLYPARLFSIYLTPTHWSVMCVQVFIFLCCLCWIKKMLSDRLKCLTGGAQHGKQTPGQIILLKQFDYYSTPKLTVKVFYNYWTKQDVPQFFTIFWHFDNWAIHPWGRLLSKYFNTDEVWLIVVDLKRVKTQGILTVSILIEKAKRILLLPPWCLFQDITVVKCFLGPLFSMFLLLSDPASQSCPPPQPRTWFFLSSDLRFIFGWLVIFSWSQYMC